MPLDVPLVSLASPEARTAYLDAAFATRHPLVIAQAVASVNEMRRHHGIPEDESWETTLDLFGTPERARHSLQGIIEAEATLKDSGFVPIEGPE